MERCRLGRNLASRAIVGQGYVEGTCPQRATRPSGNVMLKDRSLYGKVMEDLTTDP